MAKNESDNVIVIPEKKQSGISRALDKKFHFTQRGSSMGGEIGAGVGTFFIAVCALLMNTQIIGTAYGTYAGAYLAVTLIALVGTVLLGLVCNLPLVQSANMALSTVLISTLAANEGLTYANLMFVTFVAAIVYLVIVLTPARKVLVKALPAGVKKALPVGMGIYIMLAALKNTGLIGAAGASHASDFGILDTYYFWLMIAAIVIFAVFKAANRRKASLITFGILIGCMWVGGILFFMDQFMGGQTAATIVYQRLNLVVATDGAQPYNIGGAVASLEIGKLFTEGLDFSAFTAAGGNVFKLFLQGILTFVAMGLYTNLGVTEGTAVAGDYAEEDYAEDGSRKAQVIGAAMNVAAPILGTPPTSIGAQSAVGASDKGKTGLSSLTAAVGYLIAAFSWVFILFFATGTHGVGMWIDDTEVKLAAYVQDTFVFADLIMVFAGAAMLKAIGKVDVTKLEELLPFIVTVAAAGLVGDIALGVALGTVCAVLIQAIRPERKELKAGQIGLAAGMLVYAVIALM